MPFKLGDIFIGNYPITQRFGNNPAYYGQFGLKGHEGTDWGTPVGVTITSPFNGIILRDGWSDRFYGTVVVVWDPVQRCAVWFCHLSAENVFVGQRVVKGQVLGRTGRSGNVTGPHLHFNVCATDAYGNRLNKNNGYLGFLDCLNRNIVQWILK